MPPLASSALISDLSLPDLHWRLASASLLCCDWLSFWPCFGHPNISQRCHIISFTKPSNFVIVVILYNEQGGPTASQNACLLCRLRRLGVALLESVELDRGAVDLDLLDVGGPLLPLDGNLVAPEPVAVERREAGRATAQFRVAFRSLP